MNELQAAVRDRPLRVGIISGNWGMLAHAPAWRSLPGVEVAAVCTAHRETAEAAAARFGIPKAYWDHRAMAADPTLDIIDVGTRPDLRRDMVLAALACGKHVFAAANFAADLAAAREMRDAALASGKVCTLDSTMMWAPAHMQARRMIADGYIGRPATVSTRFHISLFNGPEPAGDYWRWFAKRAHGASAPRNLGTHSLHLLISLLGRVESVVAQLQTALTTWRFADGTVIEPETHDTGQMMLRFESGVTGIVTTGWSVPALVGWRMELSGDRGTIVTRQPGFFPAGSAIELLAARDGKPLAPVDIPDDLHNPPGIVRPESAPFAQSQDIATLLRQYVQCIREGGVPETGFARAFHVEAILAAAEESAKRRCWIDVADMEKAA